MEPKNQDTKRQQRAPMSEHTGRAVGSLLGGMVASVITFLIGLFIKKE